MVWWLSTVASQQGGPGIISTHRPFCVGSLQVVWVVPTVETWWIEQSGSKLFMEPNPGQVFIILKTNLNMKVIVLNIEEYNNSK